MPEEQTFSDLTHSYWDAIEVLVEIGKISDESLSRFIFWGLQLGQYDDDEAQAVLGF
jgi:hypothetical protein